MRPKSPWRNRCTIPLDDTAYWEKATRRKYELRFEGKLLGKVEWDLEFGNWMATVSGRGKRIVGRALPLEAAQSCVDSYVIQGAP